MSQFLKIDNEQARFRMNRKHLKSNKVVFYYFDEVTEEKVMEEIRKKLEKFNKLNNK